MENVKSSSSSSVAVGPVKKPMLTPKAIIHQKFGDKACYSIEEVQEVPQNWCPGLAIAQKGPCLFICRLQLPEFSVVSSPCKRKKEAEQSAAELALHKLGIDPKKSTSTVSDPGDELVSRLSYMFSNEVGTSCLHFLSSLHPLSGHLKAVFLRVGELNGSVPVSALVACDTKLGNLCKLIDSTAVGNPFLSILTVMRAASRLSELIAVSEEELWIRRREPYPYDLVESLIDQQTPMTSEACIEAVYIPFSLNEDVRSVSLNLGPKGYYLDVIAQKLGVVDASKVLISRTIGKANSEMRLYISALEANNLNPVSEFRAGEKLSCYDCSFNLHASYLLGQQIHIMICITIGLEYSGGQRTMLVGKTPDGLYKLSREAILMADLPTSFSTKANWKGSLPRDLLCGICRQHQLSEPVFNVVSDSSDSDHVSSESCRKLASDGSNTGVMSENGSACAMNAQNIAAMETFRCEIRLFSKKQDLIIECYPKQSFRKQGDAVQYASLSVLSWLNMFFKQPDVPLEMLSLTAHDDIKCHPTSFLKEFYLLELMHNVQQPGGSQGSQKLDPNHVDARDNMIGLGNKHLSISGPESGSSPSNGSFVSITYSVNLTCEGKDIPLLLESSDEFEFEIGTGAVIPCIEAALLQMTAGQSVCIFMGLSSRDLIMAAAVDSEEAVACLSSKSCCLEYCISLLRVMEPLEDRMEQALFSPPLSKQRVEYALKYIKEFSATSLIDFGCGSGSLLESLVGSPSSLEKIVGIDISQKGLIRAAKILHSKLEKLDAMVPRSRIQSVILYEGSITGFDPRLHGYDIGTCLEVIEHMQEEQACLFGDAALGLFRPWVLIVSTPNYEYNVILQKSNISSLEDDPDEKSQPEICKFRNHDHKFEWTRVQFNHWAIDLASKHNYSVEFGGVGGIADVEPGFASQIALFRRNEHNPVKDCGECMGPDLHYRTLWEWNAMSMSS
ncbi:hypothetical protein Cgig2_030665 [Carnegiea gigantea]|uniref:Small RNA 2'-O-methyltransferase n=1 Tax=Carnegiea gigantea TaxID=171969 RepID=A0A9Q1JSQ3_9CARY|nr:hypothetical protein Cgig2_030665 [Carnegiea gigantea]